MSDDLNSEKIDYRSRKSARLAVVQALYQIESVKISVASVIREFVSHRFGQEFGDEDLVAADQSFFTMLLENTVAFQTEIDELIVPFLSEWSLMRLDPILRASIRAATYELLKCPDVPAKVVINEYVDIIHAFFSGQLLTFANGVLNSLARKLRATEFTC